MSNLTEVSNGISITDGDDIEKIHLLPTSGAPGLTTEHDDAPRGSISVDELNGKLYSKVAQGTGQAVWKFMANEDDLAAVAASSHNRAPVKVMDDTAHADITAAEVAMNTGTIDGVTMVDGYRVLLPNLVTGAQDIYVISGTPGAGATYIVDTHGLHDGDQVYVQEGTANADIQLSYDGTTWNITGQGQTTALTHIRAYIGKPTTGAVLPQYSSNNYILDNDDLSTAASKLDAQVGTNSSNINALTISTGNIQTEVDAIETSLGGSVATDGTYTGFTGTSLLDASTSISDALTLLDTALGSNQDDAEIRAFIGKGAAGAELPAYSSNNIVTDGDDLEAAIGDLDTFIDRERHELLISANIGQNVVDSVLVDDVKAVVWHIHAQEVGSQDTRVVMVHAGHNGNITNDANLTDRAEYVRLRMGDVNGFRTRLSLLGVGAAQALQLEVRTNNSSNLTITRKVLI